MKQSDYKKLEPIIVKLAQDDEISIQEVMELKKKSQSTAWRYTQILVDCGGVAMNLSDIIGEATDYDKKVALEVKRTKSMKENCSWHYNLIAFAG